MWSSVWSEVRLVVLVLLDGRPLFGWVKHFSLWQLQGHQPSNYMMGQSSVLMKDSRLTASFPGQPGYASTRNVKPVWILMKQEMMGWQWHQLGAYANHQHLAPDIQPCQHLITQFSTCWMLFLMTNQLFAALKVKCWISWLLWTIFKPVSTRRGDSVNTGSLASRVSHSQGNINSDIIRWIIISPLT